MAFILTSQQVKMKSLVTSAFWISGVKYFVPFPPSEMQRAETEAFSAFYLCQWAAAGVWKRSVRNRTNRVFRNLK